MAASTAPAAPPSVAERALKVLSALPLGLIVLLTFADVFARYLFSAPIKGSVEIIQFAMALVIFTALPLVTRRRGHVTVSLIDGLVSGWVRGLKVVLCDVLSVLALALMTWRLGLQALADVSSQTVTIVLGWPQAPLTFTMAAFSLLSTLAMLALLWHSLRGREPSPGGSA